MATKTSDEAAPGSNIEIFEDVSLLSPTDTRQPSIQWDTGTLGNGNRHPSASSGQAGNPTTATTAAQVLQLEGQEKHNHHEGIYWPSLRAMGAFFFLGLFASLSHHFYYNHLGGEEVGGDHEQQWALRAGTTFAFITQVSYVSSVSFAFTQWLWRGLKSNRDGVSIDALDAGFSADTSLLSLFNFEMLRKLKVASFLASIIALLPLSSLVPPATLYVLPSIRTSPINSWVQSLDMYTGQQWWRFAHSTNTTDNLFVQLLSPRTIISRFVTATATVGEQLPIQHAFQNSSYPLQFHGPSVICAEANLTVATIIDSIRDADIRNSSLGNYVEDSNYYYAFVPDLTTNAGNLSSPNGGVTPVPQFRPQQPQNASNQLWMAFSRYVLDSEGHHILDSQGNNAREDHYLVCQLYNASYSLLVSFEDGIQTVVDRGTQILNEVDYPAADAPFSDTLLIQHAYSAVFWAMTDLLVGSMGFFATRTTPPTNFTQLTTELQYTSLVGSLDLDAFFDSNHPNNFTISDQRAQDIALAKNKTLDVLIKELGFNITTSFMTSDLLSPPINRTITCQTSINIYAYHSLNLLLSYGLALFLALVGNLLGAYAYWKNGHSHNKSFSAILTSTRDAGLTDLFHYQLLDRLPLSSYVRRARLRFGPTSGRRASIGGRVEMGFVIAGLLEEESPRGGGR